MIATSVILLQSTYWAAFINKMIGAQNLICSKILKFVHIEIIYISMHIYVYIYIYSFTRIVQIKSILNFRFDLKRYFGPY